MPLGKRAFESILPSHLEDAENGLPDQARLVLADLLERYRSLHEKVLSYDRELSRVCRENVEARRLVSIPGVGAKTATGIIAAVPDPRMFDNSHQFAAWLGLTPRQFSTGGKIRLGSITKAGNSYLRMCLIHGARNLIRNLGDREDKVSCWLRDLIERRGYFRALVAMAARNARLIWTLLIKEEMYQVQTINPVPVNR
jgi:transposase